MFSLQRELAAIVQFDSPDLDLLGSLAFEDQWIKIIQDFLQKDWSYIFAGVTAFYMSGG